MRRSTTSEQISTSCPSVPRTASARMVSEPPTKAIVNIATSINVSSHMDNQIECSRVRCSGVSTVMAADPAGSQPQTCSNDVDQPDLRKVHIGGSTDGTFLKSARIMCQLQQGLRHAAPPSLRERGEIVAPERGAGAAGQMHPGPAGR